MTVEDLLTDYPHLGRDDVLACIAYGAEMARERHVDVPVAPPGSDPPREVKNFAPSR